MLMFGRSGDLAVVAAPTRLLDPVDEFRFALREAALNTPAARDTAAAPTRLLYPVDKFCLTLLEAALDAPAALRFVRFNPSRNRIGEVDRIVRNEHEMFAGEIEREAITGGPANFDGVESPGAESFYAGCQR
jgi:hypothetical protein